MIYILACVLLFIFSGYIGKLKLQIPVRYIKSAPWVIQIDQLYVVAGPAQPHSVSSVRPSNYKLVEGCVVKVLSSSGLGPEIGGTPYFINS